MHHTKSGPKEVKEIICLQILETKMHTTTLNGKGYKPFSSQLDSAIVFLLTNILFNTSLTSESLSGIKSLKPIRHLDVPVTTLAYIQNCKIHGTVSTVLSTCVYVLR